jgi:hypothetical protein
MLVTKWRCRMKTVYQDEEEPTNSTSAREKHAYTSITSLMETLERSIV